MHGNRTHSTYLSIVAAILWMVLLALPSPAQTLSVVHDFTGGADGYYPIAGLVMDRAGNFYGASGLGGSGYDGVVFKLSHRGSGLIFTPLHAFGGIEGEYPLGVTIGPDGNLYGAAQTGGAGGRCQGEGCGTVFKLTPPAAVCRSSYCPWTATVLYHFTGGSDGGVPNGGIVFDQAGNIYGTTSQGGIANPSCRFGQCGVVYKLTPSHGSWTQSVIYSFSGGSDGGSPLSGLTFDGAGNLYGTTFYGGQTCRYGCGTVYQLTPTGQGWTETVLYSFPNVAGGTNPWGGLIFDSSGNLYGTTSQGGDFNCVPVGCGTVFSLSPGNGGWVYTVLYTFTESNDQEARASLFMDAVGNLYGTTYGDSSDTYGNVFQLTPSNGSWIYTSLHEFTRGADGGDPSGSVIMDAQGNLYGTASLWGQTGGICSTYGCGTVWEITP